MAAAAAAAVPACGPERSTKRQRSDRAHDDVADDAADHTDHADNEGVLQQPEQPPEPPHQWTLQEGAVVLVNLMRNHIEGAIMMVCEAGSGMVRGVSIQLPYVITSLLPSKKADGTVATITVEVSADDSLVAPRMSGAYPPSLLPLVHPLIGELRRTCPPRLSSSRQART
jgi:hypothetical protein